MENQKVEEDKCLPRIRVPMDQDLAQVALDWFLAEVLAMDWAQDPVAMEWVALVAPRAPQRQVLQEELAAQGDPVALRPRRDPNPHSLRKDPVIRNLHRLNSREETNFIYFARLRQGLMELGLE